MAAVKRSPLAPRRFPRVPDVAGVALAGAATGLKKGKTPDLMLVRLAPGTTVAGMLTRSRCPSAPVDWCRAALPGGKAQALVVNSGNANTFTGQSGAEVVDATVRAAADLVGCPRRQVFVASTGVIGQPVARNHIPKSLKRLAKGLTPDAWRPAAEAIMTTDTFPKAASRTVTLGDATITVAGIAKGSGMIAPDMATMLAFLFTDARVPAPVLRTLLKRAVDRSFNCVTVDGDTSTSDTVLAFATGQGPRHPTLDRATGPHARAFAAALEDVAADLSQQIARDGEGARKFVTIRVDGATSARAARKIGLAIANSPLVKTAIAGEDANWGRIVMAVGKAGERADRDRLRIAIGGTAIAEDGRAVNGYDEAPVAAHMRGSEIDIAVDLGLGRGRATVWTCDLTHGYIDINADYRT